MQFFQRKFGVISVIKNYSKLWQLWIYLDYDHLYIPLTSKKGKFQHKPTFFVWITTLFLLSLLLCGSRFLKKKHQFFRFEISLRQASKTGETYFAIAKILKNFEGHHHWHWVIYNFSKWNNGVEIWAFGANQGHFQIKLPLILILQMKQFSVMFRL